MQSNLANLSAEALSIISEAENRIVSTTNGSKVVLVAYSAD